MKITPPTTNPPSRKRTKLVLAALVLTCIAGLAWLIRPGPEPGYNGKPFTLWLEEYSKQNSSGKLDKEHRQAMKALGEMGPNAIPIIIRTLENNDSPMRDKYRETWPTLPAFIKKILPRPELRFSTGDASEMLRRVVGTHILDHLPALLQSRNPAVREVAIGMWLYTYPKPLSNEQILALCIPCLKDPDSMVRFDAAMALESIGPAASNAVPELILALQGSNAGRYKGITIGAPDAAAGALGSIGPAAASAVPALTNLLTSTNVYLRIEVASAIWHITSNESIALPVLISEGPKLDPSFKSSAIRPVGEMGPRAKTAIPMLLNELTNSKNERYTLQLVTNALKAIDPEAATKAGVKFGTNANSAIPAWIALLNSETNKAARDRISDALKAIDPEAAAKAGVK